MTSAEAPSRAATIMIITCRAAFAVHGIALLWLLTRPDMQR
jgi:hypothetical protein